MAIILAQLNPPPLGQPAVGPVVVLILFGFALIAIVGGVLWVLVRRRAAARKTDPSCGKCGYRVKGLTTFTCPECGSDLREVGIVGKAAAGQAAPVSERGPGARTLSILFSDVKDFTARTAAGSRQTAVEIVRRHREVAEPVIGRHRGRVVKHIGDALLATFDGATDALLAALEIQLRLRERNAAGDASERFDLRIAVSTGEVVVEGGDVFGDAVNLASRVQQVAAAGEVLCTEATAAMVNKREVACEKAGSFELKGVSGAVEVYRALPRVAAATLSA